MHAEWQQRNESELKRSLPPYFQSNPFRAAEVDFLRPNPFSARGARFYERTQFRTAEVEFYDRTEDGPPRSNLRNEGQAIAARADAGLFAPLGLVQKLGERLALGTIGGELVRGRSGR